MKKQHYHDSIINMKSEYLANQLAASDKFIECGYTPDDLLQEINVSHNNQLSLCYIYVCSKTGHALKAWEYLQSKVELAPQKFEGLHSASLMEMYSDYERNLFYVARNYLLTINQINQFIIHMTNVNNKLINLKQQTFSKIMSYQNSADGTLEKALFSNTISWVRRSIELNSSDMMNIAKPYFAPLTFKEIEFASQVSSYSSSLSMKRISNLHGTVLYHQWLKIFFLEKIMKPHRPIKFKKAPDPMSDKDIEFLKSILNKDCLKKMIGIDKKFIANFYEFYLITNKDLAANTTQKTLSNNEMAKVFKGINLFFKNYDEEEFYFKAFTTSKTSQYMGEKNGILIYRATNHSILGDINCFSFDEWEKYIVYIKCKKTNSQIGVFLPPNAIPCFNDLKCPIDIQINRFNLALLGNKIAYRYKYGYALNIMRHCKDKGFVLRTINELEKIILGNTSDDFVMKHLLFYFLDQTVYPLSYNFDFTNNCLYFLDQPTDFFENYLLKYLEKKDGALTFDNAFRYALDILLHKGSPTAFKLLYDLSCDTSDLPTLIQQDLLFQWVRIIKDTDGYKFFKKLKVRLGIRWEQLCYEIVKEIYEKTDVIIHYQMMLTSGEIPDIVLGETNVYEEKKLKHCNTIIECKKSVYFGSPDILNNVTTDKYLPFCDELQFWILEKPENFKAPNFSKVKYYFLDEIFEKFEISDFLKKALLNLIEENENEKLILKKLEEKNVTELVKLHEYFVSLPTPQKKPVIIKKEYVIRQYDLNGLFLQEFENTNKASVHCEVSRETIGEAISGLRKTAGGFLWEKHEKGEPIGKVEPRTSIVMSDKNVLQIDIDGVIISKYPSLTNAEKLTKINRKSIRNVINGRQKTAGGYF